MANEGIRLPSDTTVASQKVHRGNTAQDTQVSPSTSKEVNQPKTLATVVLQAKPLIEGTRSSLFELLLQNDPKSDPPIRLRSDTLIRPGTSLLLELDEKGNYQPADRPNRQQLTQLMQLELDFWRAHLLPKAGHRAFPTIPDNQTLQQLAREHPALKPLVDWLTQRPAQVTGREIQRWIQELSPLSTFRSWSGNSNQSTNRTAEPNVSQTKSITVLPVREPIITRHPALVNTPIGVRSDAALPTTPLVNLLSVPATATEAAPQVRFVGQLFRVASESRLSTLPADVLRQSLTAIRVAPENPMVTTDVSGRGIASPANTPAATGASGSPNPFPSPAASIVQLSLVPVQAPEGQTVWRLAGNSGPHPQAASQPSAAPSPAGSLRLMQTLDAPPLVSGRPPTNLPLEVRLTLWLNQIDQTIRQQPNTLQQQVQLKAGELLRDLSQAQSPMIQNSTVIGPSESAADELSLVQLRNWLDATLARVQHNAVQSAAQQIAQPEQPVQQMQLPLIWLGLTSWADLEWWQERPKEDKKGRKSDPGKGRRWRMKMYLTLAPLGKICADLDWSEDGTQLTFWSEDPATLNHLNQLLPTLNQWTEGLGERQLSTKHGMPQRRQESPEQAESHHLVDVKT